MLKTSNILRCIIIHILNGSKTYNSAFNKSIIIMGVCKKLRDLLDAMLLLGNTLMIQKNTTCLRYAILGLVKVKSDMSYDT